MKILTLICLIGSLSSFAEPIDVSAYLALQDPVQLFLGVDYKEYYTEDACYYLDEKVELPQNIQNGIRELLTPAHLEKGEKNIPMITYDRFVIVKYNKLWYLIGRMNAGPEMQDGLLFVYSFKDNAPPFAKAGMTWYGVFPNKFGDFFHDKTRKRSLVILHGGQTLKDVEGFLEGFHFKRNENLKGEITLLFEGSYKSKEQKDSPISGIKIQIKGEKIQELSTVSNNTHTTTRPTEP